MKAVVLVVSLLQVLVLAFSTGLIPQEPALIPAGVQQVSPQPNTPNSARGISPVRDAFLIAETGEIQPSSAVAYGGGEGVVVFLKSDKHGDNNIYAAVISGQDDGPFVYPISNHAQNCGHPAIAYHASSGLFIILYTHHQQDIYAVVFSPSTALIGPAHLISDDEVNKGNPAVACNQLDGVCLVAYQQSGTDIKSRYVEVSDDGIVNMSAVYDLASAIEVDQPRLAWGRGKGAFLLAFNEQLASGEVRATYTHVFDHDDPLVAEKLLHPNAPVLAGGFFPPGSKAYVTDTAFDPCTEMFVLTIDYDAAGDGRNFDLWAAVVHARDPISSGAFPIANTPVGEQGGAIRFIMADHVMPACGVMDRLVVAYINADVGLMATELRGNSSPTASGYAVDPIDQHLVIVNHADMHQISSVTLSSGSQDRQVLIAYERYFLFSKDYDLWSHFLTVRSFSYLPLVMR